jgi:hypothetical protein
MSVHDDLFAKEPERRTAEFCMDAGLRERWQLAKDKVQLAEMRLAITVQATGQTDAALEGEVQAARAQRDEVRDQVRGRLLRFTFQAMAPDQWDNLKARHPITGEQRQTAKDLRERPPAFNQDTIGPELVAASCVLVESPSGSEDHLTVEEAQAIWSSPQWNERERDELYDNALAANLMRADISGLEALGNG